MRKNRTPTADEAARILAAVARETCSYLDPRANYPLAEQAREARLAGARRHDNEAPAATTTTSPAAT